MDLIQLVAKKISKEINLLLPLRATTAEIEKVYNFHCHYPDHRSLTACAQITGLSINKCARIKKNLYQTRKLGLYYFQADTPPQKFMRQYILENNPNINPATKILEIGPGDQPIFPWTTYQNWYAVDRYLQNGVINFKENHWAENKYPTDRIATGSFENLSEIAILKKYLNDFDLVVASHSYEHTPQPLKALHEVAKMLKSGGKIIFFVPNGYSDDLNTKDPTHTIYLNPEMIQEFFAAAGGFQAVTVQDYRPNADLVITAIKS